VEIPGGATPGAYLIRIVLAGSGVFVGTSAGSPAAAPFTVLDTPAITVQPAQGGFGQVVTVTGSGWNPTVAGTPLTQAIAERSDLTAGDNLPANVDVNGQGVFSAEVVIDDDGTDRVVARQWVGPTATGPEARSATAAFAFVEGVCSVPVTTVNGSDPDFDPAVDQTYGASCSFPVTLFAQVRAGEFRVDTISVFPGNGSINKGTGAIMDGTVRGQINFYENTIPPAFTGVPNDRVLTTAGPFPENVPANANVSATTTAQEMVAKLNPLRITDARGTNEGAQLTAKVTTFATAFSTTVGAPEGTPAAGASTIALNNLRVYSTCADTAGVTNQGSVASAAGSSNGVTLVGPVPYPNAPTFVGFTPTVANTNVSEAVTLCQVGDEAAGVGAGGQFDVNADLNLTIPAFQNRGNYTSTMTITLL
jgi:hypothetical protein